MSKPNACAVAAVILTLAATIVSALTNTSDPNDPIYDYLEAWTARGLLEPAFALRPHSPEIIRRMLHSVVELGDAWDRERASAFLEEMSGDSIEPGVSHRSASKISSEAGVSEYYGETGTFFQGLVNPIGSLYVTGRMGILFGDQEDEGAPFRVIPRGERPDQDYLNDSALVQAVGLNGTRLSPRLASSGQIYAGGETAWIAFGSSRSSFGPFASNGLVLGPQAPAALNASANLRLGPLRYTGLLLNLAKSERAGGPGPDGLVGTADDIATILGTKNKFLTLHACSFVPLSRLDVTVFESLLWSDDFHVLNLLPLAHRLPLVRTGGSESHSLVGGYATLGLPWAFAAKALVFLDEVDVADLAGFNFDTTLIGAFQAGLSWAPRGSEIKLVEADYAAVAPYMYTSFYEGKAQNDYTHDGANLGPELLPNSDRLDFRTLIAPGKGVEVECGGRLIRHGNASEGVSGSSGDGSLGDSGWVWDPSAPNGSGGTGSYVPSYGAPYQSGTSPSYFRFLSQGLLETTMQARIGLALRGEPGWGELGFSVRYVFQRTINKGLVTGNDVIDHFLSLGLSISFF